ncbi:DNA polymerase alpha subunit B [Homalodisca vitripennis]|nr:DNA polymerase alpha subunit B [Homalodisca vitripennis]
MLKGGQTYRPKGLRTIHATPPLLRYKHYPGYSPGQRNVPEDHRGPEQPAQQGKKNIHPHCKRKPVSPCLPLSGAIYNKLIAHSILLKVTTQHAKFLAPIEIVIAAGPFTQTDSLTYEPLEDLMQYVTSHRPHVLILIGPLVDLRQPQLTAGSIAETYDDFFDKIVKGIVNQLKG